MSLWLIAFFELSFRHYEKFPSSQLSLHVLLLALNVAGQDAKNPSPTIKNVQVTPSVKEAEVGQDVKLTVVATDASGNVIKEQPSTYFAGPFDIAAADENGNVKLFGTGEVTVGAIVGGKPGFTTFMVKAPSIKTIEIHSLKKPIVVGGSMQLDAVTRIFNGDPRTGMPINWTSDNPQVATVDAGGVVTGVGPGKATITATSGAATATTTVSVTKSNLRSMTITAGAKSARTGDVVQFTAQGRSRRRLLNSLVRQRQWQPPSMPMADSSPSNPEPISSRARAGISPRALRSSSRRAISNANWSSWAALR